MDIISEDMFYDFLEKGESIKDKEINLKYVDLKKIQSASFYNCNFTGSQIQFANSENKEQIENKVTIYFENCSFNNLLIMGIKNIETLSFFYTEKAKQIDIFSCNLNRFIFQNNVDIDFEIKMHFCEFHEMFYVYSNEFLQNGGFNLVQNTFYQYSTIKNNLFNNLNFSKQYFKDFLVFENKFIENSISEFNQCEFEKVRFSGSKFVDLKFSNCDFHKTTWFENCKNIENTHLKFVACEFKGFVLYNHSTLNFLDIDRCTYDKSVSFTDAEFNSIKLFEVKFGGGAYFDEMKINNVINKSYLKKNTKEILEWKRTLRAIKQELQKTENKIDFNRFRGYELAAHYKELNWNWKSGFKDKCILWATKWSTDFGNSWRRALAFTLLLGLIFYSIFYFIEFYIFENYKYYFYSNYFERFFNGFVRFLIVTDFYNPLVQDRNYIQNVWSWIPFILGKIVIAFGIYEMIQSFRKFKA